MYNHAGHVVMTVEVRSGDVLSPGIEPDTDMVLSGRDASQHTSRGITGSLIVGVADLDSGPSKSSIVSPETS